MGSLQAAMHRFPLSITLLLAALVAGGCGSGGDGARDSARQARPAPTGVGPLTVAATGGRIGDATTATAGGLRELAGGRRIDPDRARRGERRREGVGAGAACEGADTMPSAETIAAVASATMCLVNGERQDAGLPVLAWSDRLAQSSGAHSEDMVRLRYFSHTSQDGRDVVDRVRLTGYIDERLEWTVGENLAWGTGTLSTPKSIVQAWMESAGHRDNILRDGYREAGLGVVPGNPATADGGGATYTMNFGRVDGGNGAPATVPVAQSTAPARRRPAAERNRAGRRKAARRACRAKVARRSGRTARSARTRRAVRACTAAKARKARAARRAQR